MARPLALAALSACLLATACGAPPQAAQPATVAAPAPASQASPEPPLASIGTATMTTDGTIRMQLRATGPGPMLGDALVTYAKDHPEYSTILAHLGGLVPGQTKPVPPFPDTQP